MVRSDRKKEIIKKVKKKLQKKILKKNFEKKCARKECGHFNEVKRKIILIISLFWLCYQK